MKLTVIILLALLTLFGSFLNKQAKLQPPMKNFDYTASWQKEEEFEKQGLPESALNVINGIYTNAKTENNIQQQVKAVIYILKLTDYKEENSFVKNLNRLENETRSAVFPLKPILHSMLAEAYWRYYQSNRYSYGQRTRTVDFKNDDISTWSLEKIVEETIKNYQLSLADEDQLKSIKVPSNFV